MIRYEGCDVYEIARELSSDDDLSQMVDTSDEWIRTRTGIGSRHVVEDETTSL